MNNKEIGNCGGQNQSFERFRLVGMGLIIFCGNYLIMIHLEGGINSCHHWGAATSAPYLIPSDNVIHLISLSLSLSLSLSSPI